MCLVSLVVDFFTICSVCGEGVTASRWRGKLHWRSDCLARQRLAVAVCRDFGHSFAVAGLGAGRRVGGVARSRLGLTRVNWAVSA